MHLIVGLVTISLHGGFAVAAIHVVVVIHRREYVAADGDTLGHRFHSADVTRSFIAEAGELCGSQYERVRFCRVIDGCKIDRFATDAHRPTPESANIL